MPDLTDKVALVTGGSKGIGRAVCLALAKAGASVVINYASDEESADELVEQIGSDRALAAKADVSSVEGAAQVVKATLDHFGKLNILVLSAGTSPMYDLASTNETDFDAAFRMNVKGPYFVAQKAAEVMKEGARIVFVSSSLCHFSAVLPEDLLYCACKGAIEQMTRVLSRDLARRHISVNAVAPGPVDGEHFRRGKSQGTIDWVAHSSPHGRLGNAEEIADVIAFLSGPESRWMTGQTVRVNGGMV